MEENIGMWLELRESGWQFRQPPHEASTCSRYQAQWILRKGKKAPMSIDRKASIPLRQYLQIALSFNVIFLVFTLISKPLTNR